MGKGGEGREGNALKTAVIVAGGLALAWVFLDRLRAAVSRSTDPSRDPDKEDSSPAPAAAAAVEEKAPAASEPSAPPVPVEEGEKVAELEEKLEEASAKPE